MGVSRAERLRGVRCAAEAGVTCLERDADADIICNVLVSIHNRGNIDGRSNAFSYRRRTITHNLFELPHVLDGVIVQTLTECIVVFFCHHGRVKIGKRVGVFAIAQPTTIRFAP